MGGGDGQGTETLRGPSASESAVGVFSRWPNAGHRQHDNTIRLWEVATGTRAAVLPGPSEPDFGRLFFSRWPSARLRQRGYYRPRLGFDGLFPRRSFPTAASFARRSWIVTGTISRHADAGRAYRSIVALTGSPKEAIALLKDRLHPVKAAEAKRVAPAARRSGQRPIRRTGQSDERIGENGPRRGTGPA